MESFLEEGRLCRCPDETQPPRTAVDDTREAVPAWGADDRLTSP